jgi:hypothetical protein
MYVVLFCLWINAYEKFFKSVETNDVGLISKHDLVFDGWIIRICYCYILKYILSSSNPNYCFETWHMRVFEKAHQIVFF